MKKFTLSIATLAIALSACGGMNEEENSSNNENQQVEEQPEANLATNNGENNSNINEAENGMNNDDSTDMESEEDTEAVMEQDFENFELNVTLVDDSQWDFTIQSTEEENEQPDASVSGDNLDLEGEQAAEEMNTYLSEFHVNAASEVEEIKTEIADTFDFNEADIKEFNLSINFLEQENETEWTWSQEEEEADGEQ
ncbi:YusW family protein [Salipaludibacillus sp. CF4.18]|uniref:YusW family protein n=1 Tax=Salipaludibacillus sp. CF4.18 TaxID=3373081 RepID=UPI003EE77AD5